MARRETGRETRWVTKYVSLPRGKETLLEFMQRRKRKVIEQITSDIPAGRHYHVGARAGIETTMH